jgi:nucleoside diphosphate kinase
MLVCCIIKPPAQSERDAILQAMRVAGMKVIAQREVMYTQTLIHVLYDHMDSSARMCITKKYAGRIGTALLFQVESLAACLRVIGTESNPGACAEGTIRARYGSRGEPEYLGTWKWWENAVHRPIDERERLRDLALLFPEHAESAG